MYGLIDYFTLYLVRITLPVFPLVSEVSKADIALIDDKMPAIAAVMTVIHNSTGILSPERVICN